MLINSKIRPHATQRSEQGYILLTLLLVIAIMAIMAFTLVTTIKFDVKRDREEEMIHRGVQYSRAIKAYYKKFNRFPVSIENLENTNQQRFLRKRYKDPLSCSEGKCRDFKLLHFGEAKLAMGGAGGGLIQGANTLGSNGTLSDPNQSSAFGGNSSLGGNSSFGTSANSAFGQSRTPNSASTGSDTSQGSDTSGQNSDDKSTNPPSDSKDKLSNTTFGGGPIVGVASWSKEATIREYDHKKKYSEWQFVYDPTLDHGGLITTPYQPMQGFGQGIQNLNGQNGSGQNGGSGFGNSPGGMQSGQAAPSAGNPNEPSDTPVQK